MSENDSNNYFSSIHKKLKRNTFTPIDTSFENRDHKIKK